MKNSINDNEEKSTVLYYAVVVSAIFASATVLSSIQYAVTALFYFALSLILFVNKKKVRVNRNCLFLLFVMMLNMFITCLFNGDTDYNYYLGLSVQMFGAYFTAVAMEKEKFEDIYINIVKIISLYSVVLTLLFNLSRSLIYSVPLVYPVGAQLAQWRSLWYIYNIWDIYANFSLIRNSACFREPGVWGAFSSLAIILLISKVKGRRIEKSEIKSLLIMTIGAITTFSTTTLVLLAFACLIYFLNGTHTKKQYLMIMIIVVFGMVFAFINRELLFAKLSSASSSYISLYDRVSSIPLSIKAWESNPIIGIGYTHYFEIVNVGVNTTSFLFVLGEFGCFMLLVMLVMLVGWCKNKHFSTVSTLLLELFVIILLNTQNLIFTPIILISMFQGVVHEYKRKTTKYGF